MAFCYLKGGLLLSERGEISASILVPSTLSFSAAVGANALVNSGAGLYTLILIMYYPFHLAVSTVLIPLLQI